MGSVTNISQLFQIFHLVCNALTVHSSSSRQFSERFQHLTIAVSLGGSSLGLLPSRSYRHGAVVMTSTGLRLGTPERLLFSLSSQTSHLPLPSSGLTDSLPPKTGEKKSRFTQNFLTSPNSISKFCLPEITFIFFFMSSLMWLNTPL